MKKLYYLFCLTLIAPLLTVVSESLEARQFRLLSPIATQEQSVELPDGAMAVDKVAPLPREAVEPLVKEIIEQWNTPGMSDTLSDQFYDKSRLLDVMDTGVLRDAKLRVQSVQGIQTLSQYVMPNPAAGRNEMVSIVSATVRTQLEFNNKSGSFVSRTGTNELILKITSSTEQ